MLAQTRDGVKPKLTVFDRIVGGFWAAAAAAVLVWAIAENGWARVFSHWLSGEIIGPAALVILVISGAMVIANSRRAKFVQMALVGVIFLVSADLCLFHLWRGHPRSMFWLEITAFFASAFTLISAVAQALGEE